MYDADAKMSLSCTIFDEVGEPRFGFGNRHTVQIDFGLDAEASARELAHCAPANRLAVISHALGIAVLHRVDIGLEALAEGLFLIGPSKPCFRRWLFLRLGGALIGAQQFRSGHGAAEEVIVVIAQGGVLMLWCALDIRSGYFWTGFKYSERDASRQTSEHIPH